MLSSLYAPDSMRTAYFSRRQACHDAIAQANETTAMPEKILLVEVGLRDSGVKCGTTLSYRERKACQVFHNARFGRFRCGAKFFREETFFAPVSGPALSSLPRNRSIAMN
jgi:hypothetical protein